MSSLYVLKNMINLNLVLGKNFSGTTIHSTSGYILSVVHNVCRANVYKILMDLITKCLLNIYFDVILRIFNVLKLNIFYLKATFFVKLEILHIAAWQFNLP